MEQDLSEVAVEINSIFDNMTTDVLNKIPLEVQEYFKEIASKSYTFTYDKSKRLYQQNIKDKTKGIIAALYRDYICSEDERREYNQVLSKYAKEKEEEKRKLYNPNEIFKNKTKSKEIDNSGENTLIIKEEKESIIKTIFNKIIGFFKNK